MKKLVSIALAGTLLLFACVDMLSANGLGIDYRIAQIASMLLTGAAVLLIYRRQQVNHSLLLRGSLGLTTGSTLLTVLSYTGVLKGNLSLFEALTLLILVGLVSRRWAGLRETLVLAALVAVLVILPWRMDAPDSPVYAALAAFAAVIVLMVGWSVREADLTTERRLVAVRNDIARDLHDDVAHHVTGIIVTAQAAALVNGSDFGTRAALERIERAGIDALESMRSLVSVLRIPSQNDNLEGTAVRWPEDLTVLTRRFERTTGLTTTLTITATDVPAVYCQTVQRVTQEALTNVSRHAQDATRVDVVVGQDEHGLRLTVTDDGQPGRSDRPELSSAGGGFGLVGIRERAQALGGQVQAGRLESGGWNVEVILPVVEAAARRSVVT